MKLIQKTKKSQKTEEKKRGFSQLENGTQPPVSFRMGRSNILRKTLTNQRWKGAARKVKVRLFCLLEFLILNSYSYEPSHKFCTFFTCVENPPFLYFFLNQNFSIFLFFLKF